MKGSVLNSHSVICNQKQTPDSSAARYGCRTSPEGGGASLGMGLCRGKGRHVSQIPPQHPKVIWSPCLSQVDLFSRHQCSTSLMQMTPVLIFYFQLSLKAAALLPPVFGATAVLLAGIIQGRAARTAALSPPKRSLLSCSEDTIQPQSWVGLSPSNIAPCSKRLKPRGQTPCSRWGDWTR